MQSAILTLLITILVLAFVVDPKSEHTVVHITASSATTTITVSRHSDWKLTLSVACLVVYS